MSERAPAKDQSMLSLSDLLRPIPGPNPSGKDTRYTVYDRIKEARREEPDLPLGVWQHERKTANWQTVANLCTDALINKPKDLQVASWLTEALGRVHTNRRASTMNAKQRNARKTTSSFSKREKMRRKPFSLLKSRSISLRFLYRARSYSQGCSRLDLGGPPGIRPRSSTSWRVSLPS